MRELERIETDRLILRRMTMDDFEDLKAIISDKETMSFYKEPYDDNGVNRWINWNLTNYKDFGFGLLAITLKGSNKMIGDSGITIQFINGAYRAEIGYHLNKNYWRKGIATEANQAIRDWAFTNTPFNTLYSYMVSENIASVKTAKKNGMKEVMEYIDKDGTPLKVCAITREEWEAMKK